MHYPGGKSKTFHHVINLIPPHQVYVEPFLGVGSVMRAKRRAHLEIGVDFDGQALERSGLDELGVHLIHGDGFRFLKHFPFQVDDVIYCDPPYFPLSRKRRRVYRHDLSEERHQELLKLLKGLSARVIISGYESDLYCHELRDWQVYEYWSKAHDGRRQERLWYNYPEPQELHDYRYLGSNYRQRQDIRRRLDRIKGRLSRLSTLERSYLSQWLSSTGGESAD